jgi:hypothetical protein
VNSLNATNSFGVLLLFVSEIMVEPQDDISTLGDPMFAPGGMLMGTFDKDEVTAR